MPIYNPSAGLRAFLKYESRQLETASGDVSYTGYGFQPTKLIIFATDEVNYASLGVSDADNDYCHAQLGVGTAWLYQAAYIVRLDAGVIGENAVVKSFDTDGFTLTWTKVGAGTPRTADMICLALA